MTAILFAFIPYKLTNAINCRFVFSDLVINDLRCLQFISLPSKTAFNRPV